MPPDLRLFHFFIAMLEVSQKTIKDRRRDIRDIKAIARPDIKLPLDDVESCWIEIESGLNDNKNIIVGCVYRHPKSKICEFIERLDALREIFKSM